MKKDKKNHRQSSTPSSLCNSCCTESSSSSYCLSYTALQLRQLRKKSDLAWFNIDRLTTVGKLVHFRQTTRRYRCLFTVEY